MSVINPETGRSIKIDGPTFNILIKSKKYTKNQLLGITEVIKHNPTEKDIIISQKTLTMADIKLELLHHLDFNHIINLYDVDKGFRQVIDLNLPLLRQRYGIIGNTFNELLINYIKHANTYTLYDLYNNMNVRALLNRKDIINYFKLKYNIGNTIKILHTIYDTSIYSFLDILLRYVLLQIDKINQPLFETSHNYTSMYDVLSETVIMSEINILDILYKTTSLMVGNHKNDKGLTGDEAKLYYVKKSLSEKGYKQYFIELQQKLKGMKAGKDIIKMHDIYKDWLERLKETILHDVVTKLKNKQVILD